MYLLTSFILSCHSGLDPESIDHANAKYIGHPATQIVGQGISRIDTKEQISTLPGQKAPRTRRREEHKEIFSHRFSQIKTDLKNKELEARIMNSYLR